MADAKTTGKTTGELIRQPHGGALRNGGTNRGGTGRPPKAFKDFLRAEIRDSTQGRQALATAAQDPDCRNFAQAWKIATEYDDEKPAEKRQIVGPIEIHVKMVREGRRLTAG
jgi:hypothetical protein